MALIYGEPRVLPTCSCRSLEWLIVCIRLLVLHCTLVNKVKQIQRNLGAYSGGKRVSSKDYAFLKSPDVYDVGVTGWTDVFFFVSEVITNKTLFVEANIRF